MMQDELIKRLKKLNPSAHFINGSPDAGRPAFAHMICDAGDE